MAKTPMKTISTSLHPEFLEELIKRSGIGVDATYIALSILVQDALLDSAARKDLLDLLPQLSGYESRKHGYKDLDRLKFLQFLIEVMDETDERGATSTLGTMYEHIGDLFESDLEDELTPEQQEKLEKIKKQYEDEVRKLKEIIAELTMKSKKQKVLEKRSGPRLSAVESKENGMNSNKSHADLLARNRELEQQVKALEKRTAPKTEVVKEVVKVKEKIVVEKLKVTDKKMERELMQTQQKYDDLLAAYKDLRKSHKDLESLQMRSGPRLERLEDETQRQKAELKQLQTEQTLLQNNLQNRDDEIAEQAAQIAELKELLKNALEGKDVAAEGKAYELSLAANAEMQKIKNQADIARPLIARIRDSISTDRNYAVYLLKVRDKQFYFARIVAFSYDTTTDKYYDNQMTGEREYLRYIVTTEHYVNGSWTLNKEGERITNAHLTNRAVDHACVPFTKKAYHSLMHMIYNEDSEKRVPLPTYTTQSVVSSPYNTNDLFNVSPEDYFLIQGINQQSDQYTIACYMVHLVRYYRKKVDTRYLHEMLKFIDALENAKTKKASVNKGTKKGA